MVMSELYLHRELYYNAHTRLLLAHIFHFDEKIFHIQLIILISSN